MLDPRRSLHLLLVAALAGCGVPTKPRPDGGGGGGGSADLTFVFPEGADLSGIEAEDGGRMRDRDAACAMVGAEATLIKKPVDIIFVIDNSGSMSEEINGVEMNINKNFAQIIGKSGLDYRVIMVTSHGSNNLYICVEMPLSGHMCNPPPLVPVNTKRYYHYDFNIQSTDSFRKLLMTYNMPDKHNIAPMGWAGYLRKDSVKMFVEITDDKSDMNEVQFDTSLLALQPALFGTAKKRNYIWHTIAGLDRNNPATKPWGPKDPEVAGRCLPGAVNNGIEYQRLSILTGGLRFPICEWANFDSVFQEIAKGVVQGSKVACEMEMPKPPMGQEIDPDTLVVEYTPSKGGMPLDFAQVLSANDCMPNTFYRAGDRIILCPDACAKVQMDDMAKLRVLFDCQAPPG